MDIDRTFKILCSEVGEQQFSHLFPEMSIELVMSNRKVWLGDQLFLHNMAMFSIQQVYLNGVINGVKQSGEHWK